MYNENYSFYYDPQRQGLNANLWKTLDGSPSATGNVLRVSSAAIIGYGDVRRGFFKFGVNVPSTPVNAVLTGGTGATAVAGTWASVTDGEFAITLDGTAYEITGIDFTGDSDMDEVAATIQAAIRAETGGTFETVTWDTDHFVITAARKTTSKTSAVSGGSGTDISGEGGTAYLDADDGAADETVSAGTDKTFGLIQLNQDVKAVFKIEGDRVVCETKDEGGTTEQTEVAWDSDWATGVIDWVIKWGTEFQFVINSVNVAIHDTTFPRSTMSLYVDNNNADNLDFSYFEVTGAASYY